MTATRTTISITVLALVMAACQTTGSPSPTTGPSTTASTAATPPTTGSTTTTTQEEPSDEPDVLFTGDGCTSNIPQLVPAGRMAIRVVNTSSEFTTLMVGRYPDGVDRADLLDQAAGAREPIPGLLQSGAGQVRGGGESTVTFTLDPGRHWAVCIAAEVTMSFATEDAPATFVLEDFVVAADRTSGTPEALAWQRSDQDAGAGTALVGDGEAFFLIQSPLLRSMDGFAWEPVTLEGAPVAEQLTGTWTDSDAADGRIVHLTVADGDATVHLFDLDAGLVHRADLPRVGGGGDVRGFVAIDAAGAAIALLYDLAAPDLPTAGFVTADGVTWDPIEPGSLPGRSILLPAAIGRGFVVTSGTSTAAYWHSPDGAIWSQRDTDQPLPGSVVSWGEVAVAFHESALTRQALSANPTFLLGAEEATELVVDLAEPLVGVGSYGPIVAAGGPGVLGLSPVGSHSGETWFAEHSPDGVAWRRDPVPFSGSGLAMAAAAGPDRFVVRNGDEVWVGSTGSPPTAATVATVTIGDTECSSNIPATVEGPLALDIHNLTAGPTAMIVGTYQPGFGRDDLTAYGRDISTRPPFIEALEIIEVPTGHREFTLDPGPGTYFVVCMDTPSTMIVLDDVAVAG